MEECGISVVWSWICWSAPLCYVLLPLCCAPQRETRSAPASWGLGPHSHLGHREKECADLMMYRKSDEPHSDPGAAIGGHRASASPAHSGLEPRTKGMWKPTQYVDPLRIRLHSDTFCAATLAVVPQSPLQRLRRFAARQDREQEG